MEQVSKGMMKELNSQPIDLEKIINNHNFSIDTPEVKKWYENEEFSGTKSKELQLKLIKHIWLNDPQFEAEKTKKWIVQTKINLAFSFLAVYAGSFMLVSDKQNATFFDTREEAEKWTNPYTEVVEVEA